jgi:Zn-dependent peptidase ImmA (M78 family)
MPPPLEPPILSYEQINEAAEHFLKKYHSGNSLPIPIEEIIEFRFGMDIVSFPNLQAMFDVDGFMAGDMSCIYVDEFVYMNREGRYRFTLAHEIGHVALHKDMLEQIRPRSHEEWEDFISHVDNEAYEWLEWQAYAFGGLVLAPREHLLKHCDELMSSLIKKIELAKSSSLPKESYAEYVIDAMASRLIKTYDVSIGVLRKRITKEVEKGNIRIP